MTRFPCMAAERYKLTAALRSPGSGVLFGSIVYLGMAVLGFRLRVFAAVAVIDLLDPYRIHTEPVPTRGWFDRLFASASNHRARHALNDDGAHSRQAPPRSPSIKLHGVRFFGTSSTCPPAGRTLAALRRTAPSRR